MKVLILFILKKIFLVLVVVSVGIYSWEKWLRSKFFDLLGIDKLNLKNNKSEIINESPDKALEKQNKALIEENKQIKSQLRDLNLKIKNKEKEISKLLLDNKNLENQRLELLEENISLGETINKLEELQISRQIVSDETNSVVVNGTNTLYANSIYGGFFNKVTTDYDENTVFVLQNDNNGFAFFDVFPKAEGRILANSSFLDGCDKQVLPDAQRVLTNNKGEAVLQADGKWRVIKKLSVTVS